MTSSQVIIHLFLPHIKWEWHHSPPPKQVLSWLLPPFGHKHWNENVKWTVQYFQFKQIQIPARRGPGSFSKVLRRLWRRRARQSSSLNFIPCALKVWFHISKWFFLWSIMHQSHLSLVFLFAETRRSSENDSQSCDVPGFLKLAWSFKQLPKVRHSDYWEVAKI